MYAILMQKMTLCQIKNEIQIIKTQLQNIGDMRPGSLTKQFRNREKGTGAYFQISYTHNMKSKTEYVRPQFVKEIRQQIRNHKKFKMLIEKWVALAIQYSQLSMKEQIERSELHQGKKTKHRR